MTFQQMSNRNFTPSGWQQVQNEAVVRERNLYGNSSKVWKEVCDIHASENNGARPKGGWSWLTEGFADPMGKGNARGERPKQRPLFDTRRAAGRELATQPRGVINTYHKTLRPPVHEFHGIRPAGVRSELEVMAEQVESSPPSSRCGTGFQSSLAATGAATLNLGSTLKLADG
mmetsp:Transcript_74952/g.139859  ORF Transcript_74952/g.139859 Transcript_74952/m.139859 type:complete len:173 (+) Transcript_74952:52-570(+)